MGVLTAFAAARRAFVGHFQAKQAPTVTLAGGGIARLMGDRFRDFAEEGYQRNVVVYRAVNLIAEGAAAISFKLFERDSLVVDGHPLLGLLARPAPLLSGVELFTALYAYRLIDGNAFLLRTGPNVGPPRELYVLRPDRIQIRTGTLEVPRAYEYVVDGRAVDVFPVDARSGQSPLRAAAVKVDQHNASARHNLALLQNDATPRGAFIYSPRDDAGRVTTLDEAQLREIKASLNQEFGGPSRSGRISVLDGDFQWQQIGMNPADMDYAALNDSSARDVALAFGVPPQLVGIPGAMTFANFEQARLALWQEAIMPAMRRTLVDLNEWLAPLFGEDLRLDYDWDSIPSLADQRRTEARTLAPLVQAGILTRNEARRRLGLEPIAHGDIATVRPGEAPLAAMTGGPGRTETTAET